MRFIELIEKYPDKPWDWFAISRNTNITMDYIDRHPDKPWNWWAISCNPNITIDYIDAHLDKPWNWNGISCNPNLTMDYIDTHPDKQWDWIAISANKYNFSSKYDIIRYYHKRKYSSIEKNRLIEEDLIKYVWHPKNMYRWSNYIYDE